ncbi:hypothetical protein [Bradyrhizobium sp. HKCCYLRH1065]|uniref:hypothetical protein n=1 Tax=unclassified Bradyrhizobium TaxID=2631580 RepID=UPI003EBB238E
MRANQLNDRLCVLAAREANRAIQTRAAVRAVAEGGGDLAAHAAPHGGDVAYAAARYPWQVSGLLGMSVKVLLDTFGHHHPDCMRKAAAAITSRDRKQNVSVVETEVHLEKHLARKP